VKQLSTEEIIKKMKSNGLLFEQELEKRISKVQKIKKLIERKIQ
jgi:hypothetical protein